MMSTISPFKSPSKRRSRSFRGLKNEKTPPKTPIFPCSIKIIVSELRLYQQTNAIILSVTCDIGIDEQSKSFETTTVEFKDSNHSFNFSFNSLNNSALYTVNQDWKRIVAKLDISTTVSMALSAGASSVHAFGVSNVPLLDSLKKSPNQQEILNIPIMNGHHKIGELKLIVAAVGEGFLDDNASQDGDVAATPSSTSSVFSSHYSTDCSVTDSVDSVDIHHRSTNSSVFNSASSTLDFSSPIAHIQWDATTGFSGSAISSAIRQSVQRSTSTSNIGATTDSTTDPAISLSRAPSMPDLEPATAVENINNSSSKNNNNIISDANSNGNNNVTPPLNNVTMRKSGSRKNKSKSLLIVTNSSESVIDTSPSAALNNFIKSNNNTPVNNSKDSGSSGNNSSGSGKVNQFATLTPPATTAVGNISNINKINIANGDTITEANKSSNNSNKKDNNSHSGATTSTTTVDTIYDILCSETNEKSTVTRDAASKLITNTNKNIEHPLSMQNDAATLATTVTDKPKHWLLTPESVTAQNNKNNNSNKNDCAGSSSSSSSSSNYNFMLLPLAIYFVFISYMLINKSQINIMGNYVTPVLTTLTYTPQDVTISAYMNRILHTTTDSVTNNVNNYITAYHKRNHKQVKQQQVNSTTKHAHSTAGAVSTVVTTVSEISSQKSPPSDTLHVPFDITNMSGSDSTTSDHIINSVSHRDLSGINRELSGVRVQLRDLQDNKCMVWKTGVLGFGARLEFQTCSGSSFWTLIPSYHNQLQQQQQQNGDNTVNTTPHGTLSLQLQHSNGKCLCPHPCENTVAGLATKSSNKSHKINTIATAVSGAIHKVMNNHITANKSNPTAATTNIKLKLKPCDQCIACSSGWSLVNNTLGRHLLTPTSAGISDSTYYSQCVARQSKSNRAYLINCDAVTPLVVSYNVHGSTLKASEVQPVQGLNIVRVVAITNIATKSRSDESKGDKYTVETMKFNHILVDV